LSTDADRAFYGYDHVRKAADLGAISTLLLSDNLFRAIDIPTRKRYVKLVEDVKSMGGQVHVFSSLHASGERKSLFNMFVR
jgi:protein pelota